jgi:predicted deacylase
VAKVVRRLTRVLLLSLVVGAVGALLTSNRDWLFFHMHRGALVRSASTLAASLQGTGVDFQEFGRVQYGRESLPLWVLRQAGASPASSTVCLLAGVHGNEPAGVQALLSLATRLHAHPDAFAGMRYVLVPLANPWGWERNLRHNGDNRDVARKFADGDAQEAKQIKALFAAERCTIFVDLHEDRTREGFYMLAYAEQQRTELARLIRSIEADSQVHHARTGDRGLVLVSEAELAGVSATTASLWARMNGAAHAFIVETSEGLPLEERVAIHLMAVDRLVTLFLGR